MSWQEGMAGDVGAIDITINPWTEIETKGYRHGGDEHFEHKVRMPPEVAANGVSMEEYLGMMDRAGVERSLVVAGRCGDMRMKHSSQIAYEQVAEYCETWPDRYSGLAGVDPATHGVREGVHEMERGIREYGFIGAHIYPHWFGLSPDAAQFYPFYYACCELDVPIMMQVGHCLDYQRDRVLPSVGFPITLERIAIDFPELKIIGIHLGWPWVDELIAMCYKHNNVYMCGDAYAPKHWPASYVHYINTFGQDKVLFGTDWPIYGPERGIGDIEELNLRPEARRKLYRDNALELFKLAGRDSVTEKSDREAVAS